MANSVLFLKGTAAVYAGLTNKNVNTFYYTTDDNQLYLGTIKLSNAEDIVAAVARIAANETSIATINETLTKIQGDETVEGSIKYAVKVAQDALEAKIGDLENLNTNAKGNLVEAINEVRSAVSAGGTAAAISIDTSVTSEGAAKSYAIYQGDTKVGTIDIPKDMVVQSGEVVVNPEGQAEGTYIKLVLANATNDTIYVNVGTLVDIYTAKAEATQVQLAIDSSTREISATIVAGSIGTNELADGAVVTAKIADGNVTKVKLSTAVQASLDLADSALQKADITSGTANGTIAVEGTDVAVTGLGGAAYKAEDYYDLAGSATAVETKLNSYEGTNDARVDALEAAVGEGGSVATQISGAIDALDVEDTAVDGKYVSAVSETDGKITVTRTDLPKLEWEVMTADDAGVENPE